MRFLLILLSLLSLPQPLWAETAAPASSLETNLSPNQPANQGLGERLFTDITALKSLDFGPENGKNLYVLMDPYCPYCMEFDKAAMAELAGGRQLRLHVIPAPILGEESQRAVLQIYSADDPSASWKTFTEQGKLPTGPREEATVLASADYIKSNFNVMKRWKFQSVPLLVWRATDGRVMMMYGTPNNIQTVWQSIGLE